MKQVDAKVRTLTPHPNLFSLDLLWRFGDKPWRRPGPMATAACIVAANAARQRGGDGDSTNRSEVAELRRKQEEKEREEEEEEARKKMNPVVRLLAELLDIVNSTTVQTLMYIVFVFVFQMLTETLRNPKLEFYFDKLITDTFIENHFDSSHNTFESVRRTADIWEWGNTVLWPGFFANLGPCGGNPGGSLQGPGQKECNDDVWPDGDGSFHMEGATAYTIPELVMNMDMLDWTDGLIIKQGRVQATPSTKCETKQLSGVCYPELQARPPYPHRLPSLPTPDASPPHSRHGPSSPAAPAST